MLTPGAHSPSPSAVLTAAGTWVAPSRGGRGPSEVEEKGAGALPALLSGGAIGTSGCRGDKPRTQDRPDTQSSTGPRQKSVFPGLRVPASLQEALSPSVPSVARGLSELVPAVRAGVAPRVLLVPLGPTLMTPPPDHALSPPLLRLRDSSVRCLAMWPRDPDREPTSRLTEVFPRQHSPSCCSQPGPPPPARSQDLGGPWGWVMEGHTQHCPLPSPAPGRVTASRREVDRSLGATASSRHLVATVESPHRPLGRCRPAPRSVQTV